MFSSKLPDVIDLKEKNNIVDAIEYTYQNYFKYDFMDKHNRKKLFGKFIYLELDFIDYMPERFWHIISFDLEKDKYTVNPCVNTEDSIICKTIKGNCSRRLIVPETKQLVKRCECIYRLRRINWINPIIELANQNDDSIKTWYEDKKTDKNELIRKVFIRFEDRITDYLIVLLDTNISGKDGYKFVTAYPVAHNRTKDRLEKSYKDFLNKYNVLNQKSGLSYAKSGSLCLQHGR